MEWADESSEGVVDGGKATKKVGSRTAGALLTAFDELRTTLEANFNKKMEQVKAEVQEMIGGFNETTAGMKDEIRQLREELLNARNESEQTRLQMEAMMASQEALSPRSYADVARVTPPTSTSSQTPPVSRAPTPDTRFCIVDTTRVPEAHKEETTPAALRKNIEGAMRAGEDQPGWRCVAITRNGRNINQLRIIGRNDKELSKIKNIVETARGGTSTNSGSLEEMTKSYQRSRISSKLPGYQELESSEISFSQ